MLKALQSFFFNSTKMFDKTLDKTFDVVTFLLLNPMRIEKFRLTGFERYFKFNIFMLNLAYCFFSLLFTTYVFCENRFVGLSMGTFLQVIQTCVPVLLSLHLATDFIKDKKIELNLKVAKLLEKTSGMKVLKAKLLCKLLVIISVRALKLLVSPAFVNVAYALCAMMPELTSSMNDFAFVYFVNCLTESIKQFNFDLSENPETFDLENLKKVEKKLEEMFVINRYICRIFSSRLLFTISFNFVQLIIALYWIFIRIAFNHLGGSNDLATFLYVIQPLLCIYTIFEAAQKCLNEVKFNFVVILEIN